MPSRFTHWLLSGLVLTWALTHATVFGQQSSKPAADRVRQGLDKVITIDYNGQSLAEVIEHFRAKTGLPISLDALALVQMGLTPEDGVGPVHMQGRDEKAGQVLRRLLTSYRLTYLVLDDAILVTSEEMAIARQLRQRVSIDVEDVPFKKAVRDLARKHGLNLVIDPKVMKQAETPISAQLENVGIETTIRVLSEMANLKAARMGNVLFITTEEKAKKIREEEAQHPDNLSGPSPYPPAAFVPPAPPPVAVPVAPPALVPAAPPFPPPAVKENKAAPAPLPGPGPEVIPVAPEVKRVEPSK